MRILNGIYKGLMKWRYKHLSDQTFVTLLSILVGLCSGLAAVVLKTLVHTVNALLLQFNLPTFVGGNGLMLIYPLGGIILTILFVRYIVRGEIGHGIPTVLLSISRHKGELPAKNMWTSLVASTLTVAFGGSVGLEAPIASTGSAIGSNIGRFFRLNTQHVKLLLGCGAAGAIAGIFKAPIAGIWFVVEVFMFDLTMTSAIPLLLSALSAATVAYFLMGTNVQFAFNVVEQFSLNQIPFYIILGVVCALSSILFLRSTARVEGWFHRIGNGTLRAIVGGLLLGVMIFLFPPLFGEGYGTLTSLLHGDGAVLFRNSIFAPWSDNAWAAILLLLALIPMKCIATATTIGCGGVGGTFGPSLVLGGLTGYFVALLLNQLGLPPQSTANFALVGMAAVMTGVMHAPFMATFLIAEITGGYVLLVPLLIASAVTYIGVSPFERHSIYARNLAKQGNLMTHDKDSSAIQLMNMRKLIETNFFIVRQGDHLRDLVDAIQNSRRNLFPVLTEDDRFVGVILLDDVRKVMFRPELYDTIVVDDLIHPVSVSDIVYIDDPPQSVIDKFRLTVSYNIIVLDEQNRYLGVLSRANVFSAYRKFVSEVSEE